MDCAGAAGAEWNGRWRGGDRFLGLSKMGAVEWKRRGTTSVWGAGGESVAGIRRGARGAAINFALPPPPYDPVGNTQQFSALAIDHVNIKASPTI